MKFMIAAALVGLVLVADASILRAPKGPGQPEPTKAGACGECAKHQPYLNTGDDCSCHASDIMRTFENDATKTTKTRSKYGDTGMRFCLFRQFRAKGLDPLTLPAHAYYTQIPKYTWRMKLNPSRGNW